MSEGTFTYESKSGVEEVPLQSLARNLLIVSRPHQTAAMYREASFRRLEAAFGIEIKQDTGQSAAMRYPIYQNPFSTLPFFEENDGTNANFDAAKLIGTAGIDLQAVAKNILGMPLEERNGPGRKYLVVDANAQKQIAERLGISPRVLANSVFTHNGHGKNPWQGGEILLDEKIVNLCAMGREQTRDKASINNGMV